MIYKYISIFFIFLITLGVYAQDSEKEIIGSISFITSKNIYVNFENTTNIKIGDTLRLFGKNTACLLVSDKSSSSAVCTLINDCEINKGDKIIFTFMVLSDKVDPLETDIDEDLNINNTDPPILSNEEIEKKLFYTEKIKGRISVASYDNFSEIREDRHRINSRFYLNAYHISDSKFSFESDINYTNYLNQKETSSPQKNSLFRVYNLAIRFDPSQTLSFTAGRRINPKASSLGAIDGLQAEKYFGKFYIGAIIGSRPDFKDYSLNLDLLEYGAYFGIESNSESFYSQTTIGIMEQRNGSQIDRRYSYFQHSSTIARNLNLFGSFELDFYSNTGNNVRLTSLYMSAGYRFSRKFDLTLSYDARKRIIYYETDKTDIEQLLENDISRQGVRIRANLKPIKHIIVGASYGDRFQSDDQNKSNNINAYATLTKIPIVLGEFSTSYNINTTNYLKSQIISLRHSRTMIGGNLNANFYFRLANYSYNNSSTNIKQNYIGADFSYNITRTLLFSLSGEMSQFEQENNYRIYTKIIKRFYGKKKKNK